MEGEITMSTLLADLGTVAAEIFETVGTVATTITSTPLMLLTVGFLFVGGAVEYSALSEPGVRRVRATVPVGQSQCSGQ